MNINIILILLIKIYRILSQCSCPQSPPTPPVTLPNQNTNFQIQNEIINGTNYGKPFVLGGRVFSSVDQPFTASYSTYNGNCPYGYRPPTVNEYSAILSNLGSNAYSNIINSSLFNGTDQYYYLTSNKSYPTDFTPSDNNAWTYKALLVDKTLKKVSVTDVNTYWTTTLLLKCILLGPNEMALSMLYAQRDFVIGYNYAVSLSLPNFISYYWSWNGQTSTSSSITVSYSQPGCNGIQVWATDAAQNVLYSCTRIWSVRPFGSDGTVTTVNFTKINLGDYGNKQTYFFFVPGESQVGPKPQGGCYVLYSEYITNMTRVIEFDSNLNIVNNRSLNVQGFTNDIVATENGFYVYFVNSSVTYHSWLMAFDSNYNLLYQRIIMNNGYLANTFTSSQIAFFNSTGSILVGLNAMQGAGGGKLCFIKGRLGLLLGHYNYFPNLNAYHQGDTLFTFDQTLQNEMYGWSWLSSHSVQHATLNDGRFFWTAALGEPYPQNIQVCATDVNAVNYNFDGTKLQYLNHPTYCQNMIPSPDILPGDGYGDSCGRLGGMHLFGNTYYVTYSVYNCTMANDTGGTTGTTKNEIGFVSFNFQNFVFSNIKKTVIGPGGNTLNIRSVKYGDKILLGNVIQSYSPGNNAPNELYSYQETRLFRLVDLSGNTIVPPFNFSNLCIPGYDDLRYLNDGTIVYSSVEPGNNLFLYSIPAPPLLRNINTTADYNFPSPNSQAPNQTVFQCIDPSQGTVNNVCYVCKQRSDGLIYVSNGECVSACNSTSVYNSNSLICSNCPQGTGVSNNQCQLSCPSGSSNVNNACVCNDQTMIIINGICARCSSNTNGLIYLSNGQCVSQCNSTSYYNSNNVCINCIPGASVVNNACTCVYPLALSTSGNSCVNCQNLGQYYVNNACSQTCTGVYDSNNNCTPCPSSSTPQNNVCVCNDPATTIINGACASCKTNTNGLVYLSNGQCLSQCNSTSIYNTTTLVCTNCMSGATVVNNNCVCSYPLGLSGNSCANCNSNGQFYVNNTCSSTCQGVYNSNNVCTSCPPNSTIVNNACVCQSQTLTIINGYCASCSSNTNGSVYLSNGQCVSSCNSTSVYDPVSLVCSQCMSGATVVNNTCTCVYPLALSTSGNSCVNCANLNQYYLNGVCVTSCNGIIDHNNCNSCPANSNVNNGACVCKNNSQTIINGQCASCSNNTNGLVYLNNNQCVSQCNSTSTYDSNNVCHNCGNNQISVSNSCTCANGYGLNQGSCVNCSSNSLYISNGACVSSCPANQYSNSSALLCIPYCNTGFGLYNNLCTNCQSISLYLNVDGTCQTTCQTNQVYNSNNVCSNCPNNEVSINNSCTCSYPLGLYTSNTSCVNCQNLNLVYSINNVCSSSCNTNNGEVLNVKTDQCITNQTCLNMNYYFQDSACVQSCSTGYITDPQVQQCVKCPSGMNYLEENLTCVSQCNQYEISDVFNVCRNCSELSKINNNLNNTWYDGSCVAKVPAYSVQIQPYVYEDCITAGLYDDPSSNGCVSQCPTGSAPVNGICTCIKGYFLQTTSNKCLSCASNGLYVALNGTCVSQCSSGQVYDSNNNCITCSNYIYNNQCVTQCPSLTILNTNNNTCYNCSNNYYFNGTCVNSCPNNTIATSNNNCSYCIDQLMYNNNGVCVKTCNSNQIANTLTYTCQPNTTTSATCPCLNGGTCINNTQTCSCPTNYTGTTCSVQIELINQTISNSVQIATSGNIVTNTTYSTLQQLDYLISNGVIIEKVVYTTLYKYVTNFNVTSGQTINQTVSQLAASSLILYILNSTSSKLRNLQNGQSVLDIHNNLVDILAVQLSQEPNQNSILYDSSSYSIQSSTSYDQMVTDALSERLTIIDYRDCEVYLKINFAIPENKHLRYIKIDFKDPNNKTSIFSLYNPDTGQKLDMSTCYGVNFVYGVPIVQSDNLDLEKYYSYQNFQAQHLSINIYDENDPSYYDRCLNVLDYYNKVDLTLDYRRNNIYNNQKIYCVSHDVDCISGPIDQNNYTTCICPVNTFNTKSLVYTRSIIPYELAYASPYNQNIYTCFDQFVSTNFLTNFGLWMSVGNFTVVTAIFLIIHLRKLKKEKVVKRVSTKHIKDKISIQIIDADTSLHKDKFPVPDAESPPKKHLNNNDQTYDTVRSSPSSSFRTTEKRSTIKSDNELIINPVNDVKSVNDSHDTEKPIDKEHVRYETVESNSPSVKKYESELKLSSNISLEKVNFSSEIEDKRTLFEYFVEQLFASNFILRICYKRSYSESLTFKIYYLSSFIMLLIFWNAILFNDTMINNRNRYNNDSFSFTFTNEFAKCVSSTVISIFIILIIRVIYSLPRSREDFIESSHFISHKLVTQHKLRFTLLYISLFVIHALCFYYIILWCNIFPLTQWALLYGFIISFGLMLICSFTVIPLIITIKRILMKSSTFCK